MTLKFVICGLEHSGTTLLSDIFRQIPELDSGFEVGVLLGASPKEFPEIHPFYANMLSGWKISEDHLKAICDTESFPDFYAGLQQKSEVLSPQANDIFDKTPRYFQKIFECQEKAKVPFVATYKDPRSIVFSDFKRTGKGKAFEEWYEVYKKPKIQYLSSIYRNSYIPWKEGLEPEKVQQILCLSLEEICLNTRETLEKIFLHVGQGFRLQYILLKNLRYHHTRVPEISSRIPFEYLDVFNTKQLALIGEDFGELKDWFYR